MWGQRHSSRSAAIPFLLLLLFCTDLLAQSRSPRKVSLHSVVMASSSSPLVPRTSFGEQVPSAALVSSFSRRATPESFERVWREQSSAQFVTSTGSLRQAVNFNLLLPPAGARLRSTESSGGRSLIRPLTFASDPPPPDCKIPDRYNDPQFYTRHIPGVGSIVDRIFQESKAHPHLTRVIKMIQPKF